MKYLLLIATAVIGVLFLFWKDVEDILPEDKQKKESKAKAQRSPSEEISIVQKWDLPEELLEVSGISYIDEQRFAAVQDESGTVFIFNTETNKIEKKIEFGGSGDYEGLAVKGDVAYVVTGSGSLYEIDMSSSPAIVKEHSTPLNGKNDVEGLCWDEANGRLLLAVKVRDLTSSDYKGVYGFDLKTNKFSATPVYKIHLDDPVFPRQKKSKTIMPSAIGIHPVTGDIFITDGPNGGLLQMSPAGKAVRYIQLGKEFAQPEGITFSPSGEMFISNEGNPDPGNIIQVRVTK